MQQEQKNHVTKEHPVLHKDLVKSNRKSEVKPHLDI
jgi:hypothetical protein